jgi:hypothetical protein
MRSKSAFHFKVERPFGLLCQLCSKATQKPLQRTHSNLDFQLLRLIFEPFYP